MNVSMEDLLKIIGDKEVQVMLLRVEVARLQKELDASTSGSMSKAVSSNDV